MVRVLGAALVAAGCAWLGGRGAMALTARVRATEAMAAGLSVVEGELELGAPPLPRLLDRAAERAAPPARTLFARCARDLDHLDEVPFARLWRRCVEDLDGLDREGRELLLPLGQLLGQRDSPAQAEGVAQVRRRLEELAARQREDSRRQGRVLQALGLSGGAFLLILLL